MLQRLWIFIRENFIQVRSDSPKIYVRHSNTPTFSYRNHNVCVLPVQLNFTIFSK